MNGYPWLQNRIEELGISQAEAARRCHFEPVYFNKMLKGREKRGMSAQEALDIARALQMPIIEVITGRKDAYTLEGIGGEIHEIKETIKELLKDSRKYREKNSAAIKASA